MRQFFRILLIILDPAQVRNKQLTQLIFRGVISHNWHIFHNFFRHSIEEVFGFSKKKVICLSDLKFTSGKGNSEAYFLVRFCKSLGFDAIFN